MNIDHIARVCHEANKAWCEANGDFSQKPWDEAESWQREATYAGVRQRIDNPDSPKSAQHDYWMHEKLQNGWVYGEIKDGEKKTHPSLVPFEDLSEFDQKKDLLFVAIVEALK